MRTSLFIFMLGCGGASASSPDPNAESHGGMSSRSAWRNARYQMADKYDCDPSKVTMIRERRGSADFAKGWLFEFTMDVCGKQRQMTVTYEGRMPAYRSFDWIDTSADRSGATGAEPETASSSDPDDKKASSSDVTASPNSGWYASEEELEERRKADEAAEEQKRLEAEK